VCYVSRLFFLRLILGQAKVRPRSTIYHDLPGCPRRPHWEDALRSEQGTGRLSLPRATAG